MVVDTSIFIEYLRAKDKKKSTLFAIPDSTQLFISSVTMYELLMGATSELMFRMMNDCIDDFENVPTSQITFKINLKKPFEEEKLFIKGSAKEIGDWDEPGIEFDKINNSTFEKVISFKEGKMFDFSISTQNDRSFLFDSKPFLLTRDYLPPVGGVIVVIRIGLRT